MTEAHLDSDASTPSTASPPAREWRILDVLIVTGLTLWADLASKAWAWDHLRHGDTIPVIDGWLDFEFGFNTGSAFGLMRDVALARMIFVLITFIALAYLAWLTWTLPTRLRVAFGGVGLVFAGALGNLHDRFVRVLEIGGEPRYGVVDFIKVYYAPQTSWPTFNIADAALVVGVGVLFIVFARHGDALDRETNAHSAAPNDTT